MRLPIVIAWMLAAAPFAAQAQARGVQTIEYEATPCFGFCPAYRVTISSDGRGVFEGRRNTAVVGRRAFRASPAQWREFRRALQVDQPVGTLDLTGAAACGGRFVTDQPGVTVKWLGAQRPAILRVNYGCDAERNARLFRALRRAPEALPIAGFIGTLRGPRSVP